MALLPTSFFEGDVKETAKNLLGTFLVRRIDRVDKALMIREVEAYDGPHDLACHAARGKTRRTEVMFGPAGRFYVYFVYGMHWMLNIVTGAEGYPAAILIRAAGTAIGPARLTKALSIDKKFNALPAAKKTGLWCEDRGVRIEKSKIKSSPRIGVSYAGPLWSQKKYRFFID